MFPNEMKVALISFENKVLADLALVNSLTCMFKGMPILSEAPNEHSQVMKIILACQTKLLGKNQ